MKKNLVAICGVLLCSSVAAQKRDLVHYVNTLQGTNSRHELTRGNTYPTTALPFGMHTWTPQTGKNGDGWKYQYHKDHIRGFQQAHQCSSWTRDYAVFSLMPETEELLVNEDRREAAFSHADEIAKPHYYRVKFKNEIITEMSPTERGAHLRFTFPKGKRSFLVLDGYTRLSAVHIYPLKGRITGFVNNGEGFKKGWKSFFVIQFNKPVKSYGTWDNKSNEVRQGELEGEGLGKGAYVEFAQGETVQAKVASSYISAEQAALNLRTELGNDHIRADQSKGCKDMERIAG
jgi:putative alpha-1,2-mannosidase